jgi:flagellar hook-associated protein 1 FlgK
MDINIVKRDYGTIAVLTTTGRPLISGGLNLLSFSASSTVNAAQAYPDQLGGIMLGGVDISSELQTGGLRGLMAMRDQVLPQAQGQLDEIVSRLSSDLVNHGLELFNDSVSPTPTLYAASAAAAVGTTSITPGAAPGGPAGGPILQGTLLRFSNDPNTTYVVTSVGASIGIRPINGGTGLQVALAGDETIEFFTPASRLQVNPDLVAAPYLLREGTVSMQGTTISSGGPTITGTALADTITTTGGGPVTVNAGDGDNTIFANAATSIINLGKGGAGFNQVILSGASSAYAISTTGTTTTISGGPSGTIVLTGVQQVQFSDKTVTLRDTSANSTLALSLIDMFERPVTFPNAAMLGITQTYGAYMNNFLSFQGTQRANAADDLARQSSITESVQIRLKNQSGVNVDTELALMTQLQNAYASNARIIQAVRDMFDELMKIGT